MKTLIAPDSSTINALADRLKTARTFENSARTICAVLRQDLTPLVMMACAEEAP